MKSKEKVDLLRMIFHVARSKLIPITATPNTTQAMAGRRCFHVCFLLSFKKHSGGRIYANAQADVAPMSSKTAPKSQVKSERDMADTTREVVNNRCRLG